MELESRGSWKTILSEISGRHLPIHLPIWGQTSSFFLFSKPLLINCLSIHHETWFSSMCISRVKRSKWLLLMKILGVFRSYLETATSEDYMCKSHLDAMKSNRLLGNCQGEEIKRENKRWGKFSMPVAELGWYFPNITLTSPCMRILILTRDLILEGWLGTV